VADAATGNCGANTSFQEEFLSSFLMFPAAPVQFGLTSDLFLKEREPSVTAQR
jgi:hypothetical protein